MAGLTYKKAGVDIDKADAFIDRIRPLLSGTSRAEVLGKVGGFSGMFQPRLGRMREPVLVASTDGVGTKLLLAETLGKFDTVGIDLVAMCVNDVLVTGAEPLFFLDYIACGRLDDNKMFSVMKGITRGCRDAGCALLGGETAELPGMYPGGEFDLAGFCVGLADRSRLIDGQGCRPGDVLIGLASSGLHSNGFSLARKVFRVQELKADVGRTLLKPTRIYVKPVREVLKKVRVKAMAHITGGGFYDNIPRVLPQDVGAVIHRESWNVPRIFRMIQARGKVDDMEMFRTFNMGVGLVLVVSKRSAAPALERFREQKQKAWVIGELTAGGPGVRISS
ncbi:MAG: phosphoribosylformylglycinamidine cyclo-ligase [Candidatus Aminicenantaceae bacterium]